MTNRITEGEQDWLTADEFVTLTHVLGPRRVARIIADHTALSDAREALEPITHDVNCAFFPETGWHCSGNHRQAQKALAALRQPASGGQA